jgi:hypothetical protein
VHGNVALAAGDDTFIETGSFNMGGTTDAWTGRLDLGDGGLIVNFTGASPFTRIANQIKQGYDDGQWNGGGINSSAAALADDLAVGYALASDLGVTSFMGQPIDGTTVLAGTTLYGDTNLDRIVNIIDFSALASNFNTPGLWHEGDFNFDGAISILDFSRLASNFNLTASSTSGRPVPEPRCIALAAILAAALGWPRRRK